MLPKTLPYLYLSVCLLILTGCNERKAYPVSGHVSFKGEAVSNGQITFISHDKKLAPDAGRIENGEYHLQATPGQNRVEIRAARIVRTVERALGPQYQDYIPAKFNRESALHAEVQASNDNRLDFDLEPDRER